MMLKTTSSAERLPPVMMKDLVVCTRGDFCGVVRKHVQRLEAASFSPQEIEIIERDHADLFAAYHNEQALRDIVDRAE